MDTRKAAIAAAQTTLGPAAAADFDCALDLSRAMPANAYPLALDEPVPPHIRAVFDAADRNALPIPLHADRETHPAFDPANSLALINGD